MSESIEEKQLFLRNEIIDQGYNPEAFSNYMGSLRGENGLDLETWSFQDLQKVVNDFKSQMAQHQQNQAEMPPQQNESQNQEQEQNVQQNQEQDIEGAVKDNTVPEKAEQKPVTNSDSNAFPNDPFEKYEQIIKTGKLKNNDITEQNNLFVTISNPKKVNPGLFSASYFQYDVQTNPVGYKVVRKVSDFTFLYDTLPLFNSAVFNPVLPHFEFGLKDDSQKKCFIYKIM